jgi:hypothetical protein
LGAAAGVAARRRVRGGRGEVGSRGGGARGKGQVAGLCILLNCACASAADAASHVPSACTPATPHQTSRTSHASSVTLSASEFLRPGPRAVTLCPPSRSDAAAVPRALVPRAAAAADAAAEGSGAQGTPDAPRDVDLAARRALEGDNAVGDRQADLTPRACAQWSAATTASAGRGWREHRWVGGALAHSRMVSVRGIRAGTLASFSSWGCVCTRRQPSEGGPCSRAHASHDRGWQVVAEP